MPIRRLPSILTVSLLLTAIFADSVLADSATTACASSETLDPSLPAIVLTFAGCDSVSGATGLNELSGLTAVAGGSWWTVSNDRSRLYRMSAGGKIKSGDSIDLGEQGIDLEGVVEVDGALYAIEERKRTVVEISDLAAETPSIRVVDIEDSACASSDRETLCAYLRDPKRNSGFEGIAFTGELFYVVTEKDPGVLITLSRDLEILDHAVLNCGTYEGSCPSGHPFPNDLDFSGLSWDAASGLLWIASDEARAVFLYDPATRKYSTYPLVVRRGDGCRSLPRGSKGCIQQPEGVAVLGDMLRVVADRTDPDNSIVYEYTITRP